MRDSHALLRISGQDIHKAKEIIRPWTPHWVFHGSGVLHNERTGRIACPCNCPGGILADNRQPVFEPKPTVFFDLSKAPPKNSKVIVKIRPRTGTRKYRKFYRPVNGGIELCACFTGRMG